MIGQPKPLASLSSGLLARKGQAKPAMRPQGFSGFGMMGNVQEDLGWNDMGHEYAPEDDFAPTATSLSALTPASEPQIEPVAVEPELPPVLRQREALREEFAPVIAAPVEEADEDFVAPVARPALSPARVARIGREVATRKTKAAFTLRLEAERHLKLRLASAVTGRSSQQLVTQALDSFLETLPEVGELAHQLPTPRSQAIG